MSVEKAAREPLRPYMDDIDIATDIEKKALHAKEEMDQNDDEGLEYIEDI